MSIRDLSSWIDGSYNEGGNIWGCALNINDEDIIFQEDLWTLISFICFPIGLLLVFLKCQLKKNNHKNLEVTLKCLAIQYAIVTSL